MKLTREVFVRTLLAIAIVFTCSPGVPVRPAAQAHSQEAVAPAALPAGVERVTSVEGITEYRLANGLNDERVHRRR